MVVMMVEMMGGGGMEISVRRGNALSENNRDLEFASVAYAFLYEFWLPSDVLVTRSC